MSQINVCDSFSFEQNKKVIFISYDTIIANLFYFQNRREKCLECEDNKFESEECKENIKPLSIGSSEEKFTDEVTFGILGSSSWSVLNKFISSLRNTKKTDDFFSVTDDTSYPAIAYMLGYFMTKNNEYMYYPILNQPDLLQDAFIVSTGSKNKYQFIFDPLFLASFRTNMYILFNYDILVKSYLPKVDVKIPEISNYELLIDQRNRLIEEKKKINDEIIASGYTLQAFERLEEPDLDKDFGSDKRLYSLVRRNNYETRIINEKIIGIEERVGIKNLNQEEKILKVNDILNDMKKNIQFGQFVTKINSISFYAIMRNPKCLQEFLDFLIKKHGNKYLNQSNEIYRHRIYNYELYRTYMNHLKPKLGNDFELDFLTGYIRERDMDSLIFIFDMYVFRTLFGIQPMYLMMYIEFLKHPKYFVFINRIVSLAQVLYDLIRDEKKMNEPFGIDTDEMKVFFNIFITIDSLVPKNFKLIFDGNKIAMPIYGLKDEKKFVDGSDIRSFDDLKIIEFVYFNVSNEESIKNFKNDMYISSDYYEDEDLVVSVNKLRDYDELYGIERYIKLIDIYYSEEYEYESLNERKESVIEKNRGMSMFGRYLMEKIEKTLGYTFE